MAMRSAMRILPEAATAFAIRLRLATAQGPLQVDAELWFQPIAYRWAMNLKKYDAAEPKRFVGYYEQTASGSGVTLARASATR